MHIFHSNWIPWFSKSQICSQVSKPTNSAEPRASHPSPLDQSKEELDLYWKVFFSEILISMFSPRRGTCERLLWLLASQMTQPFILHHLYLFKCTHMYRAFCSNFPRQFQSRFHLMLWVGGQEATHDGFKWRAHTVVTTTLKHLKLWCSSQCTSGDGLLTVWYQIKIT